jgi:hypothetical protein
MSDKKALSTCSCRHQLSALVRGFVPRLLCSSPATSRSSLARSCPLRNECVVATSIHADGAAFEAKQPTLASPHASPAQRPETPSDGQQATRSERPHRHSLCPLSPSSWRGVRPLPFGVFFFASVLPTKRQHRFGSLWSACLRLQARRVQTNAWKRHGDVCLTHTRTNIIV